MPSYLYQLNPIKNSKIGLLSLFQECPTIAHSDGGTFLNLANKIQISLEEVSSITKTSTVCSTKPIGPFFGDKVVFLVLLEQWWDILKYKYAN